MSPHINKQVLFVHGIPASLKFKHAKYIDIVIITLSRKQYSSKILGPVGTLTCVKSFDISKTIHCSPEILMLFVFNYSKTMKVISWRDTVALRNVQMEA